MNPAEKLLSNDPASKMLAIQLKKAGDESCILTMIIRSDMTNGYTVCHGGFIYTLADTACAFASAQEDQVFLSANSQIEYLAPALLNDNLVASAKITSTSGRNIFCDVEIRNQHAELIAIMRSKLVKKKIN